MGILNIFSAFWKKDWENVTPAFREKLRQFLGEEIYNKLDQMVRDYHLFERVYLGSGDDMHEFARFLNQAANLLSAKNYPISKSEFLWKCSIMISDSLNGSHTNLAILYFETNCRDEARKEALTALEILDYYKEHIDDKNIRKKTIGLAEIGTKPGAVETIRSLLQEILQQSE